MILFLTGAMGAKNNSSCPTDRLWPGHTTSWLQPNFCARIVAGGGLNVSGHLYTPRGLHIDESTDEILLVERDHPNGGRVIRLDDALDDAKIVSVAEMYGLNHGLELSNGYLYASTPGKVYRWPYISGQTIPGNRSTAQEVIVNIDAVANSSDLGAKGGHTTRTLAFDPEGKWLYVSTGSKGNVAFNSFRARIRRFDISTWDEETPFNFTKGQVFADGLRNEVGLAFDSHGVMWGVENGADNLYREDLGGDINNENPGEELNRFRMDQIGEHWGYPYCFTEYCLDVAYGGTGIKGGNNTVWAWPTFIDDGYTDEWCRQNTNPPVISMPSHSAPLGITFYDWKNMTRDEYDEGCSGGFPHGMDKFAFIAFHGSWNREPPTGYKVVYVPFDNDGNATYQPIDLFRHEEKSAKWFNSNIRPVDVQFDRCGRLFVTEDHTGSVIVITYEGDYFDEYFEVTSTDVADGVGCEALPFPSSSPMVFIPSSARLHQPAIAVTQLLCLMLFLVLA